MPAEVSLQDILEAMDLPNQEWQSFLDPETGEIITITDEDRSSLEDEELELPDWQREHLPKVREVLESDWFLRLPDSVEIHEWSWSASAIRSMRPQCAANFSMRFTAVVRFGSSATCSTGWACATCGGLGRPPLGPGHRRRKPRATHSW